MTVALPERHPILLRGVVVALIAAFLMTATGAFQTGEAPFLKRLFYWTAAMITGGLWGHACSIVVGRFVDADERPWLAVTCLSIVITGPLSVLVWAQTTNVLPWVLVQGGGMLTLLWLAFVAPRRHALPVELGWVIGLYFVAKLLELSDGDVFDVTAHAISGHSLKHWVAAAAAWPVLRALLQWRES